MEKLFPFGRINLVILFLNALKVDRDFRSLCRLFQLSIQKGMKELSNLFVREIDDLIEVLRRETLGVVCYGYANKEERFH